MKEAADTGAAAVMRGQHVRKARMDIEKTIEYKRQLLAVDKGTISDAEMRQRASIYQRMTLDYRGAVCGEGPSVTAPVNACAHGAQCANAVARRYVRSGVQALLVHAQDLYYDQQMAYMGTIRADIHIPILRDDLIIDKYQICQALLLGADAIVLNATVLTPDLMDDFVACAHEFGLQTVTEVSTPEQMNAVSESGTDLLVVNNAAPNGSGTFLTRTREFASEAPQGISCLSWGGISTPDDVRTVHGYGACGAIVDTMFMRTPGIHAEISAMHFHKTMPYR